MSVADLIRQRGTSTSPLSPQELVARYQRLRAVCRNVNNAMVQRFSRDVLFEGGRKLGLLKGDTFVFDTEDETSVLMDYCLYHVRRNGRTAVEEYCCDHPPIAGTDEAACLRAMQNARLRPSSLYPRLPAAGADAPNTLFGFAQFSRSPAASTASPPQGASVAPQAFRQSGPHPALSLRQRQNVQELLPEETPLKDTERPPTWQVHGSL